MSRQKVLDHTPQKSVESKTPHRTAANTESSFSSRSSLPRVEFNPASLTVSDIQHLQRAIGNQATGQLLAKREDAPRQPAEVKPHAGAGGVIQAKTQAAGDGKAPAGVSGPTHTGLPDHIKQGVENLSGYAMDDVAVHYNSGKPAQIRAHAYAQGTDIYLSRGQEKHLPHEAWHVAQQKQGRAKATKQLKGKGVPLNDERRLEHEADVMGAKIAAFEPEKRTDKHALRTTSSLSQAPSNAQVVQGLFYVDVLDDEGQVNQVDLHRVNSIKELEKLIWKMPDDELNDPHVRMVILEIYKALQDVESQSFTSKALSFGATVKEAPSKLFGSISNSAKSTFGFGQSGSEAEKSSLRSTSNESGAKSEQLGRDLKKTAIDTVGGQAVSQGASLIAEHSVPGISMVIGAARSGQLIFRGLSSVTSIDPEMAIIAAKAKAKGYEEISDDPVSSDIRDAITTLAKGQSLRGVSTLGSTATGGAVGIGIGAALTAPIGAVPGAIVGGIIGSIAGLIASASIEKGTRDIHAEANAVKTLVKVIQISNQSRGRTVSSGRDRAIGYGATSSSINTTSNSNGGSEKGQKKTRVERHQSAQSNPNASYQNAPYTGPTQANIDALAACAALRQLGVEEDTLQSLNGLEANVLAQLKIG